MLRITPAAFTKAFSTSTTLRLRSARRAMRSRLAGQGGAGSVCGPEAAGVGAAPGRGVVLRAAVGAGGRSGNADAQPRRVLICSACGS